MSRLRILLFFVVATALVLILALLARSVLIQQSMPGGVIVTNDYRLTEAHTGDLAVASSTITVETGGQITGSASLVGENVVFTGDVTGDLTILAPQVTLSSGSVGGRLHILADHVEINIPVAGTVLIDADSLSIGDQAQFGMDSAVCVRAITDIPANATPAERCPLSELDVVRDLESLRQQISLNTASTAAVLILGTAFFIAMVALIVSLFPARVTRVVLAMNRRPVKSAFTGLAILALIAGLTGAQIVLLGTISLVGLVALPLYLAALIAGMILITVGLIALALLIGARLTGDNSEKGQPPVVAAAVGSLIIAVVLVVILLQPFGQVVSLIGFSALAVVGAGAALGTRLGTPSTAR